MLLTETDGHRILHQIALGGLEEALRVSSSQATAHTAGALNQVGSMIALHDG